MIDVAYVAAGALTGFVVGIGAGYCVGKFVGRTDI